MFGYVIADRTKMTEEQQLRYRSCYCGLCRALGETYGSIRRLALNYDMTFLILLLSSLYESKEEHKACRCAVHLLRPHEDWQSEITAYAAAMNIALAYHNAMDDWHDDKSLPSLAQAALFRSGAEDIAKSYPRQWSAILDGLQTLSALEEACIQDPDAAANAFGKLMGELFVYREDHWQPYLRQLGQAMGRFIYLLDAVLDLPKDKKHRRYNPLFALAANGRDRESFRPMLRLLLGEATEAFEALPLLQDAEILRNILYSGVWLRFDQTDRAAHKEANHV